MTPMMKAKEVIRMGRNRRRAALSRARSVDAPSASASRANSTMRIAFLLARPTRNDQADLREDVVVAAGQFHPEDG